MNKHTLLALTLLTALTGKIVAVEASISEAAVAAEQVMDEAIKTAEFIVTPVSEKVAEAVAQTPAFYTKALEYVSIQGSAAVAAVKGFSLKDFAHNCINGAYALPGKAAALVPSKEEATTFVSNNKYAVAVVGAVAVAASAYAGYKLYAAKTPKKAA